jgi:hypothetical protein
MTRELAPLIAVLLAAIGLGPANRRCERRQQRSLEEEQQYEGRPHSLRPGGGGTHQRSEHGESLADSSEISRLGK